MTGTSLQTKLKGEDKIQYSREMNSATVLQFPGLGRGVNDRCRKTEGRMEA